MIPITDWPQKEAAVRGGRSLDPIFWTDSSIGKCITANHSRSPSGSTTLTQRRHSNLPPNTSQSFFYWSNKKKFMNSSFYLILQTWMCCLLSPTISITNCHEIVICDVIASTHSVRRRERSSPRIRCAYVSEFLSATTIVFFFFFVCFSSTVRVLVTWCILLRKNFVPKYNENHTLLLIVYSLQTVD